MGTNFYVQTEPFCPYCGRGGEELHIGKSSIGWCFSLHVIPEMGLNSLGDWQAYWVDKAIKDEYGNDISHEEMLFRITERSFPKERASMRTQEMLTVNHAEQGPRGLLRHQVGHSCIGHGPGTWDYITGDFS